MQLAGFLALTGLGRAEARGLAPPSCREDCGTGMRTFSQNPHSSCMMYRRRLPHVLQAHGPVFLTWSLHGSIPSHRGFPRDSSPSSEAFAILDRLLDAGREGPRHLSMAPVAQVVVDAIHQGEVLRHYRLCSWVVMPNHGHMLVDTLVPLPKLLRSLKSVTAKRANLLLNRTGHPFWAEETFDRNVRDREDFGRIKHYIEDNPVTAGLVVMASDYRWSSAFERSEDGGAVPRAEARAWAT